MEYICQHLTVAATVIDEFTDGYIDSPTNLPTGIIRRYFTVSVTSQ